LPIEEKFQMSAPNSESFLDRWGTALVIVYGLLFVAAITMFSPKI